MTIDHLLIERGLADADQIEEALTRVKLIGGTVEDHLLRLGYVGEADLVAVLGDRNNRPYRVLGDSVVAPDVLRRLSAAAARDLAALPLAYDDAASTLTVAVADPGDPVILEKVAEAAEAGSVELVGAVPSVLRCRIVDSYRSCPGTGPVEEQDPAGQMTAPVNRGNVLLVSSFLSAEEHFARGLVGDGYQVTMIDDPLEASAELERGNYSVLIILGRSRQTRRLLADRARRLRPGTTILAADSAADLLLKNPVAAECADLVVTNLRACIALLSSDEEMASGRADIYGRFVEMICHELGLPPADRLLITNAAFLHDLARIYLGEEEQPEWAEALGGASDDDGGPAYPPELLAILRASGTDPGNTYNDRLPLEILGANILKAASDVLERVNPDEPLPRDQYLAIRDDLRRLSGIQLFPQVVAVVLQILERKVEGEHRAAPDSRVLILNERGDDYLMLEPCLHHLGFEVETVASIERCATLYVHRQPEFLVVLAPGEADRVVSIIDRLKAGGADLESGSVFLLPEGRVVSELTYLLKEGIEDITPLDGDLDPLLVRMVRIRERQKREYEQRLQVLQAIGTQGTLKDMNLIDLLQTMGHAGKTARISVTGAGEHLVAYLKHGNLIFAECDAKTGPEAVYAALEWTEGVWSVDPVEPSELPEPNVDEAIDAILMEGCRLIDEQQRGEDDNDVDRELFADDIDLENAFS